MIINVFKKIIILIINIFFLKYKIFSLILKDFNNFYNYLLTLQNIRVYIH